MNFSDYQKGTASVWGGETELFPEGAITPPIVNSVTYGYKWHNVATGKAEGVYL